MRDDLSRSTLVRYVIVGVGNTCVGFCVIVLLELALGFTPVQANAGGYLVGLLFSYAMNRSFTFRSDIGHKIAVPAFVGAALVCYLLNLWVLHIARTFLQLPSVASQGLAVAAYAGSFYLANRYIVFIWSPRGALTRLEK